MSVENRLLSTLRQPDYVPASIAELAQVLELNKKEIKRLRNAVHTLLKEGTIAQVKGDKYCIARDADLISGIIRFRQSGSAVVIPDNPADAPEGRSLFIRGERTGVALHGDHVLVRLSNQKPKTVFKRGRKVTISPEDDRVYARVMRILERANTTVVGTLQQSRMFFHVVPDDPRISRNILVPDPARFKGRPRPRIGDKVVVKLLEWTQPHMNPEGEILEILGKTHTPDAEFKALLHKHNLELGFPDDVMREVKTLSTTVSEQDCVGRLDCRGLFTITIDPDDAKDFDDALSIETLERGEVRVGVHIADVSYYVKPGTALDREASRRGNSSYLVGCVIPMLPHELSNGICSLVENEDRLTKAVFFTFTANGRLKETQFANTVIRSNKRLTYRQAYAFMTLDSLKEIAETPLPASHQTGSTGRALKELSRREMQAIRNGVRTLWNIASRIRQNRFKQGSLEFDMPEVKIYVDEQGFADRIERIQNDESHQLIEEFMLMANDCVAETLDKAQMPYISRVHDKPDEEKLNELREYLVSVGIQCGDLTNRKEVIRVLGKFKDHPEGYSLNVQFLRSLKRACYRAERDGHYGLYKTFYAHFTSPIRRYADLIIHRVYDAYLQKDVNPTAPTRLGIRYTKAKLESLSAHISITEQNSTEAERESVKIKLLEYFEREAQRPEKREFDAVITDVKNSGIFVELTESLAYGLIPMSTLKDDFYQVSVDKRAIVGRRMQRRFALGQTIQVTIDKVDRFRRMIDFRLAGNGKPTKLPANDESTVS